MNKGTAYHIYLAFNTLPEFDKLFEKQSRVFDVENRAEITRKMERLLLEDFPDDRGYCWKLSMGYWNRVQN